MILGVPNLLRFDWRLVAHFLHLVGHNGAILLPHAIEASDTRLLLVQYYWAAEALHDLEFSQSDNILFGHRNDVGERVIEAARMQSQGLVMNRFIRQDAILGQWTACVLVLFVWVNITVPLEVGTFSDDIDSFELSCDSIPCGEAVVSIRVH